MKIFKNENCEFYIEINKNELSSIYEDLNKNLYQEYIYDIDEIETIDLDSILIYRDLIDEDFMIIDIDSFDYLINKYYDENGENTQMIEI
jgi:hypothetical protein